MTLTVVDEDSEIIVINKPAGLATIPERLEPEAPSLWRLVETQIGQRLWVVHRLDKDTSGIILFAKSSEAHRALNIAFENRLVKKTYLAWVYGRWEGNGICAAPLREFGSGRVAVDEKQGKPALSLWKVLKTDNDYSYVELSPATGRRHQLRAHLYHLGHSIIGDPLYGLPARRSGWLRMYLHAQRIEVPRLTGTTSSWEISPDLDFVKGPSVVAHLPIVENMNEISVEHNHHS